MAESEIQLMREKFGPQIERVRSRGQSGGWSERRPLTNSDVNATLIEADPAQPSPPDATVQGEFAGTAADYAPDAQATDVQQNSGFDRGLSASELEAMQEAQYGGQAPDFIPFVPNEALLGELPNDAPGDDRVDNALKSRTIKIDNSQALDWLLKDTGLTTGEATGALISGNMKAATEFGQTRAGLRKGSETVQAVTQDLGKGGIEAPTQIMGGAVDAAQAALDGIDMLGDQLAALMGDTSVDPNKTGITLPKIREPNSITGSIIRGVAQFLTGYATAGRFIKIGGAAGAMLKGAVSDFAFFNGQDNNLSNLIQANPALANPVNEFLATNPDDSEATNRLKRAMEGLGLGALSNAFGHVLRSIRAARAAQVSPTELSARTARATRSLDAPVVPARPLDLLGPENVPLTSRRPPIGKAGTPVTSGEKVIINTPGLPAHGGSGRVVDRTATGGVIVKLDKSITPNLKRPDVKLDEIVVQPGELVRGDATNLSKTILTSNEKKLTVAAKETVTGVPDDIAAKSLTKGLTPLGNGDVYVNFARIDGPEDIKRVIQDVSTALKGNVDEARRGVRTHAQTKASAEEVDAFNVLMQRRSGQPLNAEESVAVRSLWTGAADKLQEVAREAAANPSPENLFQFRKMLATFHAVQKEALGARAETARALNSWKIPVGGDRQRMATIEAAMNNFGGTEVSQDMARKIANANDIAAISEFAEKSVYAKTRDAVHEYWVNAILSGPKTHMVNMLSNSYVVGLDLAEHATAARVGQLLGGENVVQVGEATARAYGILAGFKDALHNVGRSWRTGQTGFGVNKIEGGRTRAISSTAWNLRSDSWQGRTVDGLGAVVNIPGRALQAEDEFFKTIGYRMSLHGQAYRQVQKEIQQGVLDRSAAKARLADLIANPTEDMSLEAAAKAAYQTFTSEPGPAVRWLAQGRSRIPGMKFVLPFLNTPSNIIKYTFERSPLAPLSSSFRAAMAKGGADADLAMTKMGLGTMTMMLGLDMALNGQLTGSGPASRLELDNLRRSGWQPNSIKFGDKYFAYNRLDPLGAQLGMAAELGEYLVNSGEMDNTETENFTRAFAATVFAAAETASSKTYLTGLSDIIAAVNEPDRYATYYVKRFAGGFVPNILRETTRAIDPVPRYTVGLVDEMKSRLPGFSEDLPPRRDLWGREIRWESGIGRPYDTLSPLYGSTYKAEPIDLEMQKDGWFLGTPGKAFKYDGREIRLRDRPDVYSRLLELQGSVKASELGSDSKQLVEKYGDRSLLETLNDVVTGKHPLSSEYAKLSNESDREDFLRLIVGRYRAAAKDVIMHEFPELRGTTAE